MDERRLFIRLFTAVGSPARRLICISRHLSADKDGKKQVAPRTEDNGGAAAPFESIRS